MLNFQKFYIILCNNQRFYFINTKIEQFQKFIKKYIIITFKR